MAGLLLAAWGLSGCVNFVARQIEHPDHVSQKQLALFRQTLGKAGFREDAIRTQQGVHIAYWYGQPRDYGVTASFSESHESSHAPFRLDIGYKALETAKALPVRGSVVLLHPWGMEGSAMALWGLSFAGAGYDVVMPDLRGNGQSDNAPVGYGPREAEDIVELVHQLEASHRLPAPVYLLGVSYGGTVALFAAPQLAEVRGVMALEPYANAVDVIHRAPTSGLFGYRWLARLISPHELDEAIARADSSLGVDLARIDPGAALAETKVCTLILGGSHDELIPPSALRPLAQRSPEARFVEVDGAGHVTLPMRTDRLFPPMLKWIDALPDVPNAACPGYAPLPAVTTPTAHG